MACLLRWTAAIVFAMLSLPSLLAQTCSSFSLSPASQAFTYQGGTGVIAIATTPATCTSSRTASTTSSWIVITSGASGTGAGTVNYSVQANTGITDRSGVITVAGQNFTVTQQATPCIFSLDHTTASFPTAGGNDQISIGALPSGCSTTRTVSSNSSWITISFGPAGTGAGSAGYTVAANNFLTPRTGVITAAGIPFTVTQAAGSCSYSVSGSASATVPAAGGSGAFNFTSNNSACPWNATTGADWLTITSSASGTGSGSISFTAAQNPFTAARSATLTVETLTFTVNQSAACGVTVSPLSVTVGAAGGTGTITITLSGGSGCNWTAASNNPDFITLTGAASGTANGSTTYSVAANTTGVDRVGSISINSTGVSILQPSNCTFGISPATASFPATGGAGVFTLTASCPWTLNTNGNDWLTANPATGAAGATVINYAAAPNTSVNGRNGSITIGTQSFSVAEAGVPCSVTVNPASFSFPNAGGSTTISVSAADGCSWAAATQAKWLIVANTNSLTGASGSGDGQLTIAADPNPDAKQRTSTIAIANQLVSISEDAQQCDYQLSPPSATFGSSGGAGSVTVNTRCSWTAVSSAPWLNVINGAGTGTAEVRYSVTRLPSADSRSATITIGAGAFTLTQTASPCALTLGDSAISVEAEGGRRVLKVTGNSACRWQPSISSEGAGWLTISSWSNVSGGGLVVFRYETNLSPSPRQASIIVSAPGLDPLSATVTQDGGMPVLTDGGILNAASAKAGLVAPGEMIIVRGQGLGPQRPVEMQLSDDGTTVLNTLAGVQLLFDGMAAPLLRVSDKEVRAVAPYGIAGQTSTQVTLINQGVVSNAQTLEVVASTPGIFTVDPSGAGQIDARNTVDGSVNNAANPVTRNAVVTFYLTGEGQTRPAGVDGLLNASPGPVPLLTVTVQIGGQPAAIVASGGSAGDVAGRMRIDARVAQQVAPGAAVPVIVRIGQTQTQPGVTIAVK